MSSTLGCRSISGSAYLMSSRGPCMSSPRQAVVRPAGISRLTMTNASAVELEGLKRLPSHRPGDDQLSLPKLVLAHFLRGEERAAEAAARLAGESGYSLAEI